MPRLAELADAGPSRALAAAELHEPEQPLDRHRGTASRPRPARKPLPRAERRGASSSTAPELLRAPSIHAGLAGAGVTGARGHDEGEAPRSARGRGCPVRLGRAGGLQTLARPRRNGVGARRRGRKPGHLRLGHLPLRARARARARRTARDRAALRLADRCRAARRGARREELATATSHGSTSSSAPTSTRAGGSASSPITA